MVWTNLLYWEKFHCVRSKSGFVYSPPRKYEYSYRKSSWEKRNREISLNNSVLIILDSRYFFHNHCVSCCFRSYFLYVLLFTWANNTFYVCQRLIYRCYFRISATILLRRCVHILLVFAQSVAHRLLHYSHKLCLTFLILLHCNVKCVTWLFGVQYIEKHIGFLSSKASYFLPCLCLRSWVPPVCIRISNTS